VIAPAPKNIRRADIECRNTFYLDSDLALADINIRR